MQTISYKQACELLGVKYVTIKDAVLYGKLTKCSGVTGTLLLREQVELFKSKKISLNSLTLEERDLWGEYKKIAENAELLKAAVSSKPSQNERISATIARQIQAQGETQRVETADNLVEQCIRLTKEITISIKIEAPKELEAIHP